MLASTLMPAAVSLAALQTLRLLSTRIRHPSVVRPNAGRQGTLAETDLNFDFLKEWFIISHPRKF